MPAKMTFAMWMRGWKNALVVMAIGSVVLGPIMYAVSALTQRSFDDSFQIVILVVFALTVSIFFISRIYSRATSGAVILDCGPNPNRLLFLFFGIFAAGLGFTDYYESFMPASMDFAYADVTLALLFPAFYFSLAFGHLQIRECGIWQYWGLLKWKHLKSYEWQGEYSCTLAIQSSNRYNPLRKGVVAVPPEQKHEVDQLIRKYATFDS
jgi:hypothetical protein